MFQQILYSIVGDWGRAAIEWMVANSTITATVLLIWSVLLLTGKAQLKRVETRTLPLMLVGARRVLAEDPELNAPQIYERLYPEWCQMVRRSAWFVPHRWEMWPLPAVPRIVRDRMGFTPQWLELRLAENNIHPGDSGMSDRRPQGR